LVEGYIDLEQQVQPNGFDITVRDIAMLQTMGKSARITDSGNCLNWLPWFSIPMALWN